jgi:hypothetical protein
VLDVESHRVRLRFVDSGVAYLGVLETLAAPAASATVAAICALLVTRFGWHGADLPAQVYRAGLFHRYGLLPFDALWYGGHYLFTYSVLVPVLTGSFGVREVGVGAAVLAAVGFARVVRSTGRLTAGPAALVFALGTAVPLLIGEITFLVGAAVGLWALAASGRGRHRISLVLALACSLASPLAGLFLVISFAAWAWNEAAGRIGRVTALAGAAAPLAVSALAFPEASDYSFRPTQLATVLGCSALAVWVLPRELRTLRMGVVLYALSSAALATFPNPVGGNMLRLGTFIAPAVVIVGCWPDRRRMAAALILPALVWQWGGGITAMANARGDPTRSASYFRPLLREIATLPHPARLEVPPTAQHWEAAYIAPHVLLARGWERQVDRAANPIFYEAGAPTAASYHAWLDDNGVGWVAVPDVATDPAGEGETALVRHGLSYLQPVWHNAHWRLWRVLDTPGLTSGPGRLEVRTPSSFSLTMPGPGTTLVRLHYTRTWRVSSGRACVLRGPAGWTTVEARAAGRVVVASDVWAVGRSCGT